MNYSEDETMYLAFNELSVDKMFWPDDLTYAKQLITEFITFINASTQRKLLSGLVTDESIYTFKLFDEYGIKEWMNDPIISKEQQRFFRRFIDKNCTYVNKADYSCAECTIKVADENKDSIGCLVAVLNGHKLLSIVANEFWEKHHILGQLTELDYSGEIKTENVKIENVYHTIPLDDINIAIIEELYDNIYSGQDLWEKRCELFPNLIFCNQVKDQLFEDSESYHIKLVMQKLKRIDEYFASFNGIYDPKELGLGARTESESVKKDDYLKNLRLFRKPDGTEDYFFDHIGFSGKYAGRIHFLPDSKNKKCYIGYIGRHLKTKQY